MNLLKDLYLQQQSISQNPVQALGMSQANAKTPQQMAYDSMLQAQKQRNKREIIDNTLAGLGTGLNGLGKIVANATVNNPWQQEAVANSLNANDDRLQQQMRDYAQRQAESRINFVDEAKEQLALANADADKQYAREQDEAKFAYQKMKDIIDQANKDRQMGNQETLQGAQIEKLKADTDVARYGISPEAIEAQEKLAELKKGEDEDKKAREDVKNFQASNSITPETYIAIYDNPKLRKYLKSSGNFSSPGNMFGFLPWKTNGNTNKYELDYAAILTDKGIEPTQEAIKKLKKDLGIK